MLHAAYVGKNGLKIDTLRTFNPALFTPGTTYDPVSGHENTISNLENVNNRTLYEPGILGPTEYLGGNDFREWYHSFQTQITKRYSNGLSVIAAYTLAKTLDNSSRFDLGYATSDPFDIRMDDGRADFDSRNSFVASYLWSPPWRHRERWENALLGGWTFSGITTIASGIPITFLSGTDVAVDGTQSGLEHAFVNGQAIALSHSSRAAMINQFFNTAAFVNPTCGFVSQPGNPQSIEQQNCTPDGIKYSLLGKYGNSGRNILSGPGFSNTDFAILKEFPIKEGFKGQFRAECFNLLNQVNFSNPDSTITDGTFGEIQSAGPGRVIQFALKLTW
jgi:hypothetical protein